MPHRSAGRSDGRGSDDGDGSRYDWLYGGSTAGSGRGYDPPPSDDPDPTRMMPTLQRPGRRDERVAARDTRPDSGYDRDPRDRRVTPPPAAARGSSRSRRRRRPMRIVLLLLLLWVVFLVVVPLWAWGKVHKVDIEPAGTRPEAQSGTNYLLVGSDSRRGLTAEQRKQLSTGDAAGQRTDTIMVLHTGSGPSVLLSIPRDSLVPIPGYGTDKINAAYAYGGPKLLVQTIEQNTGLHVDHYLEIGLGGFANVIDAVGGIQICPARRIRDHDSGLNVRKGCQQVDGVQGLAWARARHPFASGDLARAQHQREVIGKISGKLKSPWTFINPFRYYRIMNAGATSLAVDKGSNPFSMMSLVLSLLGKSRTCTMPIADMAVHWDSTRALALMHRLKEDNTEHLGKRLCSPTGLGY